MDFIEIKLEGAWDIIWLALFVLALLTSSGLLITWIRSLITKKTEKNKLDTIKVVQQQVDLLEDQIQSLTKETDRLFSISEETRLHKIALMKQNILLQEELKSLKEEVNLLREQNILLNKRIDQMKVTKEMLTKQLKKLEEENLKLVNDSKNK